MKKLNRKQRAERRAMYANTFQSGFQMGWDLALKTYGIKEDVKYEPDESISLTSGVRRIHKI